MTDSPVPVRTAGKLGARESHEPRLLMSNFKLTSNPTPSDWDGSHGWADWKMDGNDQYGDCGAAAVDHGLAAQASDVSLLDTLGGGKFTPAVLGAYFAYGVAQGEPGPEPDQGVDNASWLGYLYEQGIIDFYGEVPPGQINEYANDFGMVLIAVTLTDSDQAKFAAHETWTCQDGSQPDPSLGHDVIVVAYSSDGKRTIVTWGALQDIDLSWSEACITDAWCFGTWADVERSGHDPIALGDALVAIHGVTRDVPAPVDPTPTPEPAPVDPTPAPDPSPAPSPSPSPVDPTPEPTPSPEPLPPVDPPPAPAPSPDPVPVDPPVDPTPVPVPEPTPEPTPSPEPDQFLHELRAAVRHLLDVIERHLLSE